MNALQGLAADGGAHERSTTVDWGGRTAVTVHAFAETLRDPPPRWRDGIEIDHSA